MSTKTRRLTESAMMIAIAIALELLSKSVLPPMPFGGQLTLCAMFPVVLLSYRHGVKWGLVSASAYALLEMAIGTKTVMAAFQPGYFGDGVLIANALVMCLLDYVVAFTALGLGGIFRNRIQKSSISLMAGSLVALGARYVAHVASGYILFAGYAEWFFTHEDFPFPELGEAILSTLSPAMLGFVYSLVYNAMYMIPEMIFTAIVSLLIARVPKIVSKLS